MGAVPWYQTPLGAAVIGSLIGGLLAALGAGLILLYFATRAQRMLMHYSVHLQTQRQIFLRFGEIGMEAQFLLSRAQAVRRAFLRGEPHGRQDWPATGLALMDKEAGIRSLAGPMASHFSRHDPEIDDLYPQFLNLFVRLRRVLMRQESWDRAEFERDQDRLNDLYGELDFRMGGIVEEGKPRSQGEMEEYRRSVEARREAMRRQVQEQQTL